MQQLFNTSLQDQSPRPHSESQLQNAPVLPGAHAGQENGEQLLTGFFLQASFCAHSSMAMHLQQLSIVLGRTD